MKVLITTDLYTTETNGVVTSVKNLVQVLTGRGHEVRILTLAKEPHSSQTDNVYFIRSLPIGFIYPDIRMPTAFHHRLIKELIDWKPDVIHSQCEFFTFQFAEYVAKHTGAPVVHTYHTLYEQYVSYVLRIKGVGQKAVGHLSRLRLRKVERIIAPTHKVEQVLQDYGIKVPISVIPSGIRLDQHFYRLSDDARLAKRQELGIGPDDQVLVNVGRIGNEKNLDEVLQYFSQLCQERPNLRLLLVGGGPAKEHLEALAKSLGVDERVIFTGMVSPDQVQEYYQLGDIFVSASTSETQGLTYVEAAANGLPLLCRQDPCLEDVMSEGLNGYTYNDVEEFYRGVDAILSDEDWLQQAKEYSQQIAATFGHEAFGKAVEEVYESVIAGNGCTAERN